MTIEINGMAHVILTVSRFEVAREFYRNLRRLASAQCDRRVLRSRGFPPHHIADVAVVMLRRRLSLPTQARHDATWKEEANLGLPN